MKKILAKIILITGSILPILISPIYAETEFERKVREMVEADKRRIQEEYNKFSAAKNYGIALCLINNKGVPREMAIEQIILFGLRQQKIDPNYYKDKRVEIMGERIAKRLDKDCARLFEYKEMKEVINFLSVKPIKEDSNLYNEFFNSKESPKESTAIRKDNDDKHSICLKAADYKGCMNYQNR